MKVHLFAQLAFKSTCIVGRCHHSNANLLTSPHLCIDRAGPVQRSPSLYTDLQLSSHIAFYSQLPPIHINISFALSRFCGTSSDFQLLICCHSSHMCLYFSKRPSLHVCGLLFASVVLLTQEYGIRYLYHLLIWSDCIFIHHKYDSIPVKLLRLETWWILFVSFGLISVILDDQLLFCTVTDHTSSNRLMLESSVFYLLTQFNRVTNQVQE